MLVKKINPEWQPSENPALPVGGVMEITDPYSLIMSGMVVAVDESGDELSSYDIYGVASPHEMDEFKRWKQMKKATAENARLQAQQEELKTQVAAAAPVTEAEAPEAEAPKTKAVESLSWNELQVLGKELGVYSPGMSKDDVIAAIKKA